MVSRVKLQFRKFGGWNKRVVILQRAEAWCMPAEKKKSYIHALSVYCNKKEGSRETYVPFVVSGGHHSTEEANWPKTVFGKVNLIVAVGGGFQAEFCFKKRNKTVSNLETFYKIIIYMSCNVLNGFYECCR